MMSNRIFPALGRSWEEVKSSMEEARQDDLPWHGDRLFKPAYFAGDDVLDVANQAFQMYVAENALYGGTSYPSLHRYETEIVGAVLEMLHAPEGASGSVTTGGTESNFMAIKTARDWARDHRPQAAEPEIVVPRTAHPSFDKAAHMLDVKVVRMDNSPNFRADVEAITAAVNDNTIMLVGSATPYPYGETDPIAEIAALAESHSLWMHVDGCLGGFILPFARAFDPTIPDFDYIVPGVTSISVDVHKYGYAIKGISTLTLRDAGLETYQRTSFDNWPAGLYTTSNITASRSGGAVASAWAVLQYLGEEGYARIVESLIGIRQEFIDGINAIDELEVWATPQAFHFGFGSRSLDIFAVADGMGDRGWEGGRALEPPSMMLMLNMSHQAAAEPYLKDLAEVVAAVKAGKIQSRGEGAVYAV